MNNEEQKVQAMTGAVRAAFAERHRRDAYSETRRGHLTEQLLRTVLQMTEDESRAIGLDDRLEVAIAALGPLDYRAMLEACEMLAFRAYNHSFKVLGDTTDDEEVRFENRHVLEAATRAVRHLDQNAEAMSAYEAMQEAKREVCARTAALQPS